MTDIMNRESVVTTYEEYHATWYMSANKTKKNKRVIDMCQIIEYTPGPAATYKITYSNGNGEALDSYQTKDWQDARSAYARMVRAYCPESWKALIVDLKAAKLVAESATGDDGGTCNFDSPALVIPEGMTYQQVAACCKAACVTCFDWRPFKKGEKLAVIGCAGIGQGNRRTAGAEAACKYLESKGWKCGMYYQMD